MFACDGERFPHFPDLRPVLVQMQQQRAERVFRTAQPRGRASAGRSSTAIGAPSQADGDGVLAEHVVAPERTGAGEADLAVFDP